MCGYCHVVIFICKWGLSAQGTEDSAQKKINLINGLTDYNGYSCLFELFGGSFAKYFGKKIGTY